MEYHPSAPRQLAAPKKSGTAGGSAKSGERILQREAEVLLWTGASRTPIKPTEYSVSSGKSKDRVECRLVEEGGGDCVGRSNYFPPTVELTHRSALRETCL
jgi:hypothetical protein